VIRFTTILWLAIVACTGFAMFKVKYEVQELDDELVRVNKQIVADRDAIHVLNAEWSFLNQPARLADLSRKYLNLQPIGTAQLGQMSQLATLKMKPGATPGPLAAAEPEAAAGSSTPTSGAAPLPGGAVATQRN
jgi:hypothetical protein